MVVLAVLAVVVLHPPQHLLVVLEQLVAIMVELVGMQLLENLLI
jgi:hypothetical protein